jgi:CRISPR system Cascade subunit CasB
MSLEPREAAEAGKSPPLTIGQVIARASSALADQHFSTSDRAALRRVNPEVPAPAYAAACRLLVRCGEPLESADLDRWVFILHALALATSIERPAHDREIGFGRALAEAGVSELRFERLLTARGLALRDQIPRTARLLRANGQKGDFRAVWDLLASDDTSDGNCGGQIRARLARDYYVARAHEDAKTDHEEGD